MSWLPPVTQGLGRALLVAFAFGIGAAVVAGLALRSCLAPAQVETATAKATQALAAKNIEDDRAEGQATRKAAKAKVTQEVQDAVRDSDLVDFLDARARVPAAR